MSKYVNSYKKPRKSVKERMEPHPIWRGIGLVLAILLPVMSYAIVSYVLKNPSQYSWLTIPSELVINRLWDPYIVIKILFTLVLVLVLFMVIALFTFLIYSLSGTRQR